MANSLSRGYDSHTTGNGGERHDEIPRGHVGGGRIGSEKRSDRISAGSSALRTPPLAGRGSLTSKDIKQGNRVFPEKNAFIERT